MKLALFGTLRWPPLLKLVAGCDLPGQPVRLTGVAAQRAEGAHHPVLVAGEGAEGLLVSPDAEALERLDFYEAVFGYHRQPVELETTEGKLGAEVYHAPQSRASGEPWVLAVWAAVCGPVVLEAARDIMAARGLVAPERLGRRYDKLLPRAASRLRARAPGAAALRRSAEPGDVESLDRAEPYAAFFSVEDHRLRHRRYSGGFTEPLERAVFVSADAAVVLPYDPRTDRVHLIEQFRPGPMARGAANPWLLETVAGRIDAFETPEQAVRREAMEEAGLELGELIPAASYYPSPAAKAEYLYTFIGLADLPEIAAQPGGLAEEGEDIRCHIVSFPRLMSLVESGEVDNGPLLILALKLASLREGLRQRALEGRGGGA